MAEKIDPIKLAESLKAKMTPELKKELVEGDVKEPDRETPAKSEAVADKPGALKWRDLESDKKETSPEAAPAAAKTETTGEKEEPSPEELELALREEREKIRGGEGKGKEKEAHPYGERPYSQDEEEEIYRPEHWGVEEKGEKPLAEASEKKPEKTPEDFLKEARQDYVTALLAKERAQKDVRKLSGWRQYFFQTEKRQETKDRADEELESAQKNFEQVNGGYDKILLEYAASLFKKKETELVDDPEGEQKLKEYAKTEVFNEYFLKEAERINQVRQENLPPGQKKWYHDCLYKFSQMPKAARWAVSAGVATGVAFSFGTVAATGAAGVGAYFGIRLGRAALGTLAGGLTDKVLGRRIERGKVKTEEEIKAGMAEKIEAIKGFDEIMKIYSEQSPAVLEQLEAQRKKEHRQHIIKAIAAVGVAGGTAAGLGFLENYLAAHHYLEGMGLMKSGSSGLTPERKPEAPPALETTMEGPTVAENQPGVRGPSVILENISPESMPKISGVIEAQKGDSLWKVIERQAEASGLFKGLTGSPEDIAAQKTYVIDALKDKVAASPEKFSLADVDKLKIGQKLDLTEIFKSPQDLDEIVQASGKLSKEQLAHILNNNEILNEWIKAHPGEALTSAKVEEVLTGKIPKGRIPWQAKVRPDWPAGLEIEKPQGGPLPASVEELKQMGLGEEEISNLTERAKLVGKNFVSGTEYEDYAGRLRGGGYFDRINEQGLPTRPTLEIISGRLEKMITETMGMKSAAYDKIKVMNLEEFIKAKPAAIVEHPEWEPAGRVIDEYLKMHKFLEPKYLRGTTGDFFKKIIKIDIGK